MCVYMYNIYKYNIHLYIHFVRCLYVIYILELTKYFSISIKIITYQTNKFIKKNNRNISGFNFLAKFPPYP